MTKMLDLDSNSIKLECDAGRETNAVLNTQPSSYSPQQSQPPPEGENAEYACPIDLPHSAKATNIASD